MKVRKKKHTAEARQATTKDAESVRIWCGGQHLISDLGIEVEAAERLKAGFKMCTRDSDDLRVVFIDDWVILHTDGFTLCRSEKFDKIWEKDE